MKSIGKNMNKLAVFLVLFPFAFIAYAESVNVKYRGNVNIDTFECEWVNRSSFIKRLCFDPKESYAIVLLKSTYYHYCGVPNGVIDSWRAASSMGRFYGTNIKGNYDCRVNYMPTY